MNLLLVFGVTLAIPVIAGLVTCCHGDPDFSAVKQKSCINNEDISRLLLSDKHGQKRRQENKLIDVASEEKGAETESRRNKFQSIGEHSQVSEDEYKPKSRCALFKESVVSTVSWFFGVRYAS